MNILYMSNSHESNEALGINRMHWPHGQYGCRYLRQMTSEVYAGPHESRAMVHACHHADRGHADADAICSKPTSVFTSKHV